MKKLLIFVTIALILVTTALIISIKNQGLLLSSFLRGNAPTEFGNPYYTDDSRNTDVKISEEAAKEIALKKIDGEIVKFKSDFGRITQKYEVEIHKDKYEYEMEIDAQTGDIIEFEKSLTGSGNPYYTNDSKNTDVKISEEAAKEIALKKIYGEIVKFKSDFGRITQKYEIEIHKDKYEYEMEIDAQTGDIIEFEKSLIDD